MASETGARALAMPAYGRATAAAGMFAAGIAADAAWLHGFYASVALAGLAAIWLGALAFAQEPPSATLPEAKSADVAGREAELIRLRTMLDHAPVPLLMLTGNGVLHAANRAARSLFATDDRIVAAAPSLLRALAAAVPGERAIVKLAAPDGGGERSYALPVASWLGAGGPGLLAALIDIEPELQAAEASALRDLLQVLSHEIMNSLTPVMSLADTASMALADGTLEGSALARDALEVIARRAKGLDRFVQGYRALARVPEPVRRPVSVGRLLHDVAMLFETRWRDGVRLELRAPEPDIMVRLDPDLLGQALTALLTNGAEAALAFDARPAAVVLTAAMEGERLRFAVSDSGSGVPSDCTEAIFRPMFTLKPQGTGIGLGLARQIAASHGGGLVLEAAAEGRGALFALHV